MCVDSERETERERECVCVCVCGYLHAQARNFDDGHHLEPAGGGFVRGHSRGIKS